MSPRRTGLALGIGLISIGLLAGCEAPTKTGVENRRKAYDNLNAMNTQIAFQQAQKSFDVGRLEKALGHVTGAIERYPLSSEYHLLHGRILLEMHRLEPALKAFETAIENDDQNAEAHYYAGIIHQRWSDFETAHAEYEKASSIDGARVDFAMAGAEMLVSQGRLDEAWDTLHGRLDRFEHNASIHHLLGQIALLQGRNEEAVSRYTQAHLLDPENQNLLEELARIQYETGHYGKCLSSLQFLQMNRGESEPHLLTMEARCLAISGRSTEARNLYLELTRRNPADTDAWIELGTVAWDLGDFQRVAQCGLRAAGLEPGRYEGYMLQAINERHHGNTEEAISLFRQAAERAPDRAMPQLLLGMALEERGHGEAALIAYADALKAEPENADAMSAYERLRGEMVTITAVPVEP